MIYTGFWLCIRAIVRSNGETGSLGLHQLPKGDGVKENHLEDVCLDWLSDLGWTSVHGDDLSPGGVHEARSRYSEVVLTPRLRDAVGRLNPSLTATEADEAVTKLAAYGAQSLVDGNREVYNWLRNGVPVERVEASGHRTVLRVRVIDFDGSNDLLAVRQFTSSRPGIRSRPTRPTSRNCSISTCSMLSPTARLRDTAH